MKQQIKVTPKNKSETLIKVQEKRENDHFLLIAKKEFDALLERVVLLEKQIGSSK